MTKTKVTEANAKIKKTTNWTAIERATRQIAGQSLLGAGTVGFIVQNVNNVNGYISYIIGGIVVGLILFFANKR